MLAEENVPSLEQELIQLFGYSDLRRIRARMENR